MPPSFMAGMYNSTSTYSQPNPNVTSFSPNVGSVGRSGQYQGQSSRVPTVTTDSRIILRQQMDASNQDMLGLLAKEMQ